MNRPAKPKARMFKKTGTKAKLLNTKRAKPKFERKKGYEKGMKKYSLDDFFFSPTHSCFVYDRVVMRGVKKLLYAAFHPQGKSDFEIPLNAPSCPVRPNHSLTQKLKISAHGKYGAKFGSLIHTDIQSVVRLGKKTRIQNVTKAVIQCLDFVGLQVVDAEMPVVYPKYRTATCVDIVCILKSSVNALVKLYVIIELKTGARAGYHRREGNMNKPFLDIPFTPHNAHQLQLAATCILFRKTYPAKTVVGRYIMHVHTDGIDLYSMPDWAVAKKEAIAVVLEQSWKKTK